MAGAREFNWYDLSHNEWLHLSIGIIVLTFCFGFKWDGPQTMEAWGFNFIGILILTIISVAVQQTIQRWYAHKHHGTKIKFNIWWLGVAIALISIFLTKGYFVFAAVWLISIKTHHILRLGKGHLSHFRPFEQAKVASVAALVHFGLAVIGKLLSTSSSIATKFMVINSWLAVFSLVPAFSVLVLILASSGKEFGIYKKEMLLGDNVFFGSRLLWIFLFVFMLVATLLFVYSGFWVGLGAALIIASVIFFVWFYYTERYPEHPHFRYS